MGGEGGRGRGGGVTSPVARGQKKGLCLTFAGFLKPETLLPWNTDPREVSAVGNMVIGYCRRQGRALHACGGRTGREALATCRVYGQRSMWECILYIHTESESVMVVLRSVMVVFPDIPHPDKCRQ